MSNIINIRDFKGLWTYGDQDDIPNEYLAVDKNAINRLGKLLKTYGFVTFDTYQSAISPASGYTVYGLVCHVDSNYTNPTGYRYYLVTVNSSKLVKIYYYHESHMAWESLTLTNTYYHKAANNPIITTFDAIRFLPGNVGLADGTNESKGLWYGHIDRDYFWNSAIASQDGFYESITTPEISTTLINSIDVDNTEAYGTLAADDYYYKLTLLYDGTQETLLPTLYKASGTTIVNQVLRLQYKMLTSALNRRVTGINVYRSITSATAGYKLVHSISTLDSTYDPNLTYNTGSLVGYGLYVPDKTWTVDAYAGKRAIIASIYYTISSNTADTITLSSNVVDGYEIWGTGEWAIIDSELNDLDSGTGFEIASPWSDWTPNAHCTFERSNLEKYYGNYSGKITLDGIAADGVVTSATMTGISGCDYCYLSVAVKCGSDCDRITLWAKDDLGASTAIDYSESTDWTIISGKKAISLGATTIYVYIWVDDDSASGAIAYIDELHIGVYNDNGTNNGYCGIDTIINPDFNFDRNDNLIGYRALVGTSANGNNDASAQRKRIIHNVQRAVQTVDDFSGSYIGDDLQSYICKHYLWQKNSTGYVDLWFYDDGSLTEGAAHPLDGEVSIKINGKFARILNEVLYQYNIVLDPGGKNEAHPDWLSHSNLDDSGGCQYDVNPVGNITYLPDREGGEGTGLAVQFGGLIAFKKRAIFRLIPDSTGAISEVRESKYSEGNIAPYGYVEVGNDVYYCSYTSITKLNPNIGAETELTPLLENRISEPIQDVYNALTDSEKELIQAEFDQLNDEIVYRFKNNLVYAYNVKNNQWRQLYSSQVVDLMALDESSNLIIYDNTAKMVYKVTTDYSTSKESVAFQIRTKEFYIADDDKSQCVRYLTIVYKSAVDLKFKLYADNSSTAVTFTESGLDYITIPASSTVVTQLKIAIRYWCGRFQAEIVEGSASTSAVEVHSLKMDTD